MRPWTRCAARKLDAAPADFGLDGVTGPAAHAAGLAAAFVPRPDEHGPDAPKRTGSPADRDAVNARA